MTALELIDLLHRIDGQLGLAVYRAEPDPSTWKREADALIVEVRKAIKDLEETPMRHYCFVDDDRKAITCLCVRGMDHTEDEFDVPLTDSEKPEPAPAES